MNKQDRQEVQLMIRDYFDQFMKEHLPNIISAHNQSCPHGKRLNKLRWMAIGILIASAAFISPVLVRVLIPLL